MAIIEDNYAGNKENLVSSMIYVVFILTKKALFQSFFKTVLIDSLGISKLLNVSFFTKTTVYVIVVHW